MRSLHTTHADGQTAHARSIWTAIGGHPQGTGVLLAADEWRRRALDEAARESLWRAAEHAAPHPNATTARNAAVAAPDLPWLRAALAAVLGALPAARRRNRTA